jgi:hypothetical protein
MQMDPSETMCKTNFIGVPARMCNANKATVCVLRLN